MRPTKYSGMGGMQGYTPEERVAYNEWLNGVSRLAYQIAGSHQTYYQLSKAERMNIRETAKHLYELGADFPTAQRNEATNKQGFVYIITNAAWPGYVKIGRAFNPESRLKGYQTGCPFRGYELEYAIYFEDCHGAEKIIHDWLADYRAEGEWFRLLPHVAEHTIYNLREQNYVG